MQIAFDRVRLARRGFILKADFKVVSGASVAVIGPSGAGKSTLLSLLAGFDQPDAGRILIDRQDMAGVRPADRSVTLLFQDNNLFPHLTVFQNVALGLAPNLRLSQSDRTACRSVLARVDLADHADRRPAELSGGQQSRAALARALLRDRPVLLLDEPFAALGPALRRDMLDLVAEIRAERDMTLMIVTHDPEDARRIAGQVIFVQAGQVENPRDTTAVFDAPTPGMAAYLGT